MHFVGSHRQNQLRKNASTKDLAPLTEPHLCPLPRSRNVFGPSPWGPRSPSCFTSGTLTRPLVVAVTRRVLEARRKGAVVHRLQLMGTALAWSYSLLSM